MLRCIALPGRDSTRGHGRIVGEGSDSAASVATIAVVEGNEEEEEEEHQNGKAMVAMVVVVMAEIQDRGITKACRPSFVAGALTANSKLR